VHVRIHWKRVLIVSVVTESVLFAIYQLVVLLPPGPLLESLVYLDWFGLMFLGGLWVVQEIESGFVLHGLLVGIVANVLFAMIVIPGIIQGKLPDDYWIIALPSLVIKMAGSTAGAYIGGIRRKKKLSAQTG
jgi:hypothetical protein